MNRARMKPFLIGGGILAVGVLGLALLVALRPEPPKIEPLRQSPLVTTVQPELRQGHLTVRGIGDYLAYLDARRNFVRVETAVTAAQRALASARLAVHRALGGAWIDET